jgi:hypothetical protein
MNVILLFILIVIIINYVVTFKEGYTDEVQKIVDVLNKNNINKDVIKNIGDDIEGSQICGAPSTVKYSGESNYSLTLNQDDKRELAMKDYKLKIESGENFHMKLSELEEKVFKMYYGDKWQEEYDKMLEKRQKHEAEQKEQDCTPPDEENTPTDVGINTLNINLTKEAVDVLKYLEDLETFTKNNYDTHDKSAVTSRKLHYRNKEEAKIEWINSWFNYIYYILYISAVLLAINQEKIFTYKYSLLILLILPTVIYPLVFKILKYAIMNTSSISIYPINSF